LAKLGEASPIIWVKLGKTFLKQLDFLKMIEHIKTREVSNKVLTLLASRKVEHRKFRYLLEEELSLLAHLGIMKRINLIGI